MTLISVTHVQLYPHHWYTVWLGSLLNSTCDFIFGYQLSQISARAAKIGGWVVAQKIRMYIHKQFNFPHASTHPGLPHHHLIHTLFSAKWGLLSSSESCTVLQNRQTRSLDAKAWQHSSLTLHECRTASKEQCRRGYNQYVQTLLTKLIRMIAAMYLAHWQYELGVNARILHGKWLQGGPLKKLQNCQ